MQKTSAKELQNEARLGGEGDPLEIVQEIKIWPNYQMVYAQTRILWREWGP